MPPGDLTEADLDAVCRLAEDWQPFEVRFAEFRAFADADVHYLAPEPADPFLALTQDLCTVWPEYPPYEGAFPVVVPHLTVAVGVNVEQAAEFRYRSPAAGAHHRG